MRRPEIHFTPPEGWMNDPNGLVFHEGRYHLFYQRGNPKHWGHATSEDFLTWTHRPTALSPDALGEIWSGSVVVDEHDRSGLLEGGSGLVAVFTHRTEARQAQSLAFSRDGGESWTKYLGNPVLSGSGPHFRDPKAFWYAPRSHWAMVLAEGDAIGFYRSDDLVAWTPTARFEPPSGGKIWECPDLYAMPLEGASEEGLWALHASWHEPSVFSEGCGGEGIRYFVGTFDGGTFRPLEGFPSEGLPLGQGPDEYATITWAAPDGRRIAIGWMDRWLDAKGRADAGWPSAMTLPRELSLVRRDGRTTLVQRPVRELDARKTEVLRVEAFAGRLVGGLPAAPFAIECRLARTKPLDAELRLGATTIRFLPGALLVDGERSDLDVSDDDLVLEIVVDLGTIEIFLDGGKAYIAIRRPPDGSFDGFSFTLAEGRAGGFFRVSQIAAKEPRRDAG